MGHALFLAFLILNVVLSQGEVDLCSGCEFVRMSFDVASSMSLSDPAMPTPEECSGPFDEQGYPNVQCSWPYEGKSSLMGGVGGLLDKGTYKPNKNEEIPLWEWNGPEGKTDEEFDWGDAIYLKPVINAANFVLQQDDINDWYKIKNEGKGMEILPANMRIKLNEEARPFFEAPDLISIPPVECIRVKRLSVEAARLLSTPNDLYTFFEVKDQPLPVPLATPTKEHSLLGLASELLIYAYSQNTLLTCDKQKSNDIPKNPAEAKVPGKLEWFNSPIEKDWKALKKDPFGELMNVVKQYSPLGASGIYRAILIGRAAGNYNAAHPVLEEKLLAEKEAARIVKLTGKRPSDNLLKLLRQLKNFIVQGGDATPNFVSLLYLKFWAPELHAGFLYPGLAVYRMTTYLNMMKSCISEMVALSLEDVGEAFYLKLEVRMDKLHTGCVSIMMSELVLGYLTLHQEMKPLQTSAIVYLGILRAFRQRFRTKEHYSYFFSKILPQTKSVFDTVCYNCWAFGYKEKAPHLYKSHIGADEIVPGSALPKRILDSLSVSNLRLSVSNFEVEENPEE